MNKKQKVSIDLKCSLNVSIGYYNQQRVKPDVYYINDFNLNIIINVALIIISQL